MKSAAVRTNRFFRDPRRACRAALALAVAGAGMAALAQEATIAETSLAQAAANAAAPEAPLRIELATSALPRLDSNENGFAGPRLDLSVLPPSRSAVGLAVGMSGLASPSPTSLAGSQARPSLDVGVHMRHTLQSNHQIDVTAWRRMSNQQPDAYTLAQLEEPRYGARVEMNLKPARKGLLAERGFVGFQLEGGARISVKRKNGGPMVYYRTSF
jgi:hypothetical protein